MRMQFGFALFLFATGCVAANESLCYKGEDVIFSCKTDRVPKVVSLCASPGLTNKVGTLSYRFGVLSNVELEYPKSPHKSAEKFQYAHGSRFQTERYEVTFSIGSYSYAIFDYYEGEEKIKYLRGVRAVNTATQRESIFACRGDLTSKLQRLDGKVPCDAENALAQCN
jgi:hypothetical protein